MNSVARLSKITDANGLYANPANLTVPIDKYTFDVR